MDFHGKTALITGGSRGIGKAVCLELAQKGANIVLCYSGREDAAQETASACRALGVQAVAVQCDVSDAKQVQNLIDTALEQFHSLDILVNNAGITKDNLIIRMSEDDFDDVISTNLKGAFLCIKTAARVMMRQRYGRIINISSVVGLRGNAGQANYAASKAGIIGLTKSLAKELASRGITVNVIAPGFTQTDMTAGLPEGIKNDLLRSIPAGRFGTSEEIAKAAAFLASEDAAYITGQVLSVDGGMAM